MQQSYDAKMAAYRYQEHGYWSAVDAVEQALGRDFDPLLGLRSGSEDTIALGIEGCLEVRRTRVAPQLLQGWQAVLAGEA